MRKTFICRLAPGSKHLVTAKHAFLPEEKRCAFLHTGNTEKVALIGKKLRGLAQGLRVYLEYTRGQGLGQLLAQLGRFTKT